MTIDRSPQQRPPAGSQPLFAIPCAAAALVLSRGRRLPWSAATSPPVRISRTSARSARVRPRGRRAGLRALVASPRTPATPDGRGRPCGRPAALGSSHGGGHIMQTQGGIASAARWECRGHRQDPGYQRIPRRENRLGGKYKELRKKRRWRLRPPLAREPAYWGRLSRRACLRSDPGRTSNQSSHDRCNTCHADNRLGLPDRWAPQVLSSRVHTSSRRRRARPVARAAPGTAAPVMAALAFLIGPSPAAPHRQPEPMEFACSAPRRRTGRLRR